MKIEKKMQKEGNAKRGLNEEEDDERNAKRGIDGVEDESIKTYKRDDI